MTDRRYKNNPEDRRTASARVLLTQRELEQLQRVADQRGISMSELIRERVLHV